MDAASLPFVEDDEEGDVFGGDHDGANHGANDLDDEDFMTNESDTYQGYEREGWWWWP